MTSLIFVAGLAAIVAGVALISVPVALIVGGLLASGVALAAHGGDDGSA